MSVLTERELLYTRATVYGRVKKYDKMRDAVKALTACSAPLEEQDIAQLATAYKGLVDPLRAQAETLVTLKDRLEMDKPPFSAKLLALINEFRVSVHAQLNRVCADAMEQTSSILAKSKDKKCEISLWKLTGDYSRYMADLSEGDRRKSCCSKAYDAYKTAWDLSKMHVDHASFLKVGLLVNFTVFLYETLNNREEALRVAEKTLAEMPYKDAVDDDYTDWEKGVEAIRTNIKIWKAEIAQENAPVVCDQATTT